MLTEHMIPLPPVSECQAFCTRCNWRGPRSDIEVTGGPCPICGGYTNYHTDDAWGGDINAYWREQRENQKG